MERRKPIPNSIRFEVFKRDSFTCQYCGSKAPDVVLNVDHISPVASGGDNSIVNLITSCFSCNSGKSDKLLSDSTVIAKQQAQLESLNERRQQLEMMVEWREGLLKLDDRAAEAFADYISKISGRGLNELGLADAKRMLAKFNFDDLCQAAVTSFRQYYRAGEGQDAEDSWHRAFGMIERIAFIEKNGGLDDSKKRAYYARGILRRRLNYINERELMPLMFRAIDCGVDVEEIVDIAKMCSSWSDFSRSVRALTEGQE